MWDATTTCDSRTPPTKIRFGGIGARCKDQTASKKGHEIQRLGKVPRNLAWAVVKKLDAQLSLAVVLGADASRIDSDQLGASRLFTEPSSCSRRRAAPRSSDGQASDQRARGTGVELRGTRHQQAIFRRRNDDKGRLGPDDASERCPVRRSGERRADSGAKFLVRESERTGRY